MGGGGGGLNNFFPLKRRGTYLVGGEGLIEDLIMVYRVVVKISSCWVNTTIRRGIKHLGVSFGSNFPLFSIKSRRGRHS